MSDDDGSSNGDSGGEKQQSASLGKNLSQNSKSIQGGKTEKGTTADGNAGEEGGYGIIRPSAQGDSDGGGSGGNSDDSDE